MVSVQSRSTLRTIPCVIAVCLLGLPVYAKYSGGTGEPNDPYQIATAADLIALGETPEDYDKHFVLTADIDLDPNLPGRKVFDNAVIAPDTDPRRDSYQGTRFTGVFDGNGHTVSHLTIRGQESLGLFGRLGLQTYAPACAVTNLAVVDVNVTGSGSDVGGLAGVLSNGTVTQCRSSGAVSGDSSVGGLLGLNIGTATQCYSAATVSGNYVGGLIGSHHGVVIQCCSTGAVRGNNSAGGLVSENLGDIVDCYSTATVRGESEGGGLVSWNSGPVTRCYCTGSVNGQKVAGGLIGVNVNNGRVSWCFWNIETSGQTTSAGATGKTTAEMQDPNTFMAAAWDFVGQPNGPDDIWAEPEGGGYPILSWQLPPGFGLPTFAGGTGESDAPYLISTAEELNSIGSNPRLMKSHFKLVKSLDLAGLQFCPIGRPYSPYRGAFDGNGHTISHLTLTGESSLGLFGQVGYGATVRDLGVLDVNIAGSGYEIGGLVGFNGDWYTRGGLVTNCCTTGSVRGGGDVGGMLGHNLGTLTKCHSAAVIDGTGGSIGGLVGYNDSVVGQSYSTGAVSGRLSVGGLVGTNRGSLSCCYSTGSSSLRRVVGAGRIGGLVGSGYPESVASSFWDTQTSGQTKSDGGTGRTTAEMQTAKTFLDAGWDFVGETANGTEDIWWINEGKDYPRLWWEPRKYGGGTGEPNDPYLIFTAEQMNAIGAEPNDWDKCFKLMADIDLSRFDGKNGRPAFNVIGQGTLRLQISGASFEGTSFSGILDGNGHKVLHLTADGCAGLFGGLRHGSQVRNLAVVDVNITSGASGGLAGYNDGTISHCFCSGVLRGGRFVGGLVGGNTGTVTECYSTGTVSGGDGVGGLVGANLSYYGARGFAKQGSVSHSYSEARVSGTWDVGGLVGSNYSNTVTVARCYCTGAVSGQARVGGLVGAGSADGVAQSLWDTQTSGQTKSAGGTGKTTAEMQTAKTFLDAGWDFVDETANGTEDIWKIAEGLDYPRLWWEPYDGRVTVVLGQIFTVTLESNPSTGYRWEWVDHQDSIVEQMGEAQFKPRETGDPPLVGAGGWESFDFKAVSLGQMTLKLVYRRPWEEGVEPLKTFSLHVTVP